MTDIINNGSQQPSFRGDPYKVAADYLDQVFHLIPPYGSFQISTVVNSSGLSNSKKLIANSVSNEMERILKSEGCLETSSYHGNLVLQLNSHGRDVQSVGGLVALKTKAKENAAPNITNNLQMGDNYGQNVQGEHQSSPSFSRDYRLDKLKTTKPSKRAVLEIVSWIIGISAGLIAIYEFVIKKFFLN